MKKIAPLSILLLMTTMVIYLSQTKTTTTDKSSPEYASQNSLTLRAYELERKKNKPAGKRYDRPDVAMEYEIELRSLTGQPFSYQPNWRFAAHQQAKRFSIYKKSGDDLQWVERGPGNIGGRTRSVVVHPQNSKIWWVAAVGGGIWQTTDGGESWICQSDELPVLSATTLDICLNQPDILYAGTGEGFYNYDAIIGDGIFKTVNGGQTWTQLPSTTGNYNFRYVNRVIVHPQNPDIVFAATNEGLYRSLDGGSSWQTVFSDYGRVQQIIANPLNFNTLFIAVFAKGIYRSSDMGTTWQKVSGEISSLGRIELAIAMADTNYLYATAAQTDGSLRGFFQSTNGGKEWLYLNNQPNWLRNQGWYDNTLLVDPFDPTVVIVGGIDLFRITVQNGVMSARQLTSWYGGGGLEYVHADQHFLAAIPDPLGNYELIAVNDGGVYYSADGGFGWQGKNNNFNVTQYYDGDRHPFRVQYVAGSQDNGTNLSPSGTQFSDAWNEVLGGDGFDCAWDKEDPNIVYATIYDSRIYKSEDGGLTYRSLNGETLPTSNFFHTPLEMDPYNSRRLFSASGLNLIYVSEDGGESWQSVSAELGSRRLIKIRVSLNDSSIVWAASSADFINVSTDGGQSFSKVNRPEGAPSASAAGMETHPDEVTTAFITFGVYGYGKIFRTDDFGSSWQDITNNLPDVPVHCLLVMPYDPAEIWIGTDIGLFKSFNEGQSWQYDEDGLPAVSIRRLKIVDQEVVAVTHGRGVWTVHNESIPKAEIPLRTPTLYALNPPDPNQDRLKIPFMARGVYDSVLVKINDNPVQILQNVIAYQDTFIYQAVQAPGELIVQVIGLKDGLRYESPPDTIRYRSKVDGIVENFDVGSSDFEGDFLISLEEGFGSKTMHTEHEYTNKRQYISLLNRPIEVYDDSRLTYRDVALIEPGEPGKFYPDFQMWDYVTVEGSRDGETWDILIEPYDCRANSVWQNAYNANTPGDSSMFVSHEINLSEFYSPGEKIYLRFRLFADDYTTGWGWAIDDVQVSSRYFTSLEDPAAIAAEFKLLGNYPNPFNPQTTIRFTLAEKSAVSLHIFNTLGQRVRTLYSNADLPAGMVHSLVWDGTTENGRSAASGTYYYRLQVSASKAQQAVGKMVLLR